MPPYEPMVRDRMEFDSWIDSPDFTEHQVNFDFTIILRVHMEQVQPPKGKQSFMAPDYSGKLWPALAWNPAAWLRFRSEYTKLVLKVWDRAFVLIPPDSYDGFVWPRRQGTRRKLVCRLRLKLVDTATSAHAQVRVVRLAAPNEKYFRSDSSVYDSGDIKLVRHRYAKEGASFLHNTPAHEVGHLLGLWHPGEAERDCVEAAAPCYGSNLRDRMNIMGAGSMLELSNAHPWQLRIPWHAKETRKADWKVDWASNEAQLRGLEGFKVEETHKKPYKAPAPPGIIDL